MIELCKECKLFFPNFTYFCSNCYEKLRLIAEIKNISVHHAAHNFIKQDFKVKERQLA